jgi:hypothetical protein
MPLVAYFEDLPLLDRRRSVRRALHLGASAAGEPVVIHDLSLTGALIETSLRLTIGEQN